MASALARGLRRAGHEVIQGSRRPEDDDVRALAEETGAAAEPAEAAARADLDVLWIHRAIAIGDRRWGLAVTTEG